MWEQSAEEHGPSTLQSMSMVSSEPLSSPVGPGPLFAPFYNGVKGRKGMERSPYHYMKEPGLELGISKPKARALDTQPGPVWVGRRLGIATTQKQSKVWWYSLRQG